MIGRTISLRLDGIIWAAFELHCHNNGHRNSSDAVRALIRDLPEFKIIQAGANGMGAPNAGVKDSANHKAPVDHSVESQPTVG